MRSPQVIIPVSEGKGNRHGNTYPRSARRRHDRGCRSHRDRRRPPAPSPQQDHRVLAGRPGHASSDPSSVAHTDRSFGCERHLSGARITFDRVHLGPGTLAPLALERLVAQRSPAALRGARHLRQSVPMTKKAPAQARRSCWGCCAPGICQACGEAPRPPSSSGEGAGCNSGCPFSPDGGDWSPRLCLFTW